MRHYLAPLVLVLTSACAHVQERRSRQVLDEESVRLSETPRPDLSRASVRATSRGAELHLAVRAEARCVVQFAERVTARERVERRPKASTLAGEAVLMGAGLAVAGALRRSSSDGEVNGKDVAGVLALAAGLGAGVALVIDASHHYERESVATTTTPEGEARVAPCRSVGPRPSRVELVSAGGRRLIVPLDGLGRGHVRLAEDLWADDQIDFDVWVDGVLARRLVLTRSP